MDQDVRIAGLLPPGDPDLKEPYIAGANTKPPRPPRPEPPPVDPFMKEVADAIGFDLESWHHIAHAVAYLVYKEGLTPPGEMVVGVYRGPVSEGSPLADLVYAGEVPHMWLRLEDGTVFDPARWIFEDSDPKFQYCSSEEYDEGSVYVRNLFEVFPPPYDGLEPPTNIQFDAPAGYFAERLLRIPNGKTPNLAQLRWLGRIDIKKLGVFARPLFGSMQDHYSGIVSRRQRAVFHGEAA